MKGSIFGPTSLCLLLLAACDQAGNSKQAGTSTADVPFPRDIAAAEEPGGNIWLQARSSGLCPSGKANFLDAALFYSIGPVPRPSTANGPNPQPIERTLAAKLERVALADLERKNLVQTGSGEGRGTASCADINRSKLGSDYAEYASSPSVTAQAVNIASLLIDHVEYVSSVAKPDAQGRTIEHHTFRMFAQLFENPKLGLTTYKVTRDIVVFFDPQKGAWRTDPTYQSSWTIGT